MKSLLLLLLLAACSLSARAEEGRIDPRYVSSPEYVAKMLRQQIADEVKGLGSHEWAGEYYEGDGLGVNVSLSLAPKTGYVFEWHGCMGTYDRNYGAVTSSNGVLKLAFTFKNERKGFQGIAPEFIPVSWGNRKYLVPADDMIGFCNEVNTGSEPRDSHHGMSLLRKGDEEKPARGWPKIPARYQAYLLKKPIKANITAIGSSALRPSIASWQFKDAPLTINKGKKQGLLPGMKLSVITPANIFESIEITSVKDNEAIGVMNGYEESPEPKVGWTLSTEHPWKAKSKSNKNRK